EEERTRVAREDADEKYLLARQVVDRMLTRASDELADQPTLALHRRKLLEEALAFYQQALSERATDAAARQRAADTDLRLGMVQRGLGRYAEALTNYEQAAAQFEDLTRDIPARLEPRASLADCHHERGLVLESLGKFAEADQAFRESLDRF